MWSILGIGVYTIQGILFVLMAIAYITLAERKMLASVQRRRGPNVVGFFGLLQPFADGLKLVFKELVVPVNANPIIFIVAPIYTLFLTFVFWFIIPTGSGAVELPFTIFWTFSIGTMGVIGIITAGWSSNSKYAFLGGIRSTAQMLSYELCLSTIYLTIVTVAGDSSLMSIVEHQERVWYIVPLFPVWVIFTIVSLAETNRAPFDLPEAEAELVSGYNVEYGAVVFAMFFLGEYGNMLVMSFLGTVFFLGGWLPINLFGIYIPGMLFFGLKMSFQISFFVWARAALPRYRYDQLMLLGWKVLVPLAFSFLLLCIALII